MLPAVLATYALAFASCDMDGAHAAMAFDVLSDKLPADVMLPEGIRLKVTRDEPGAIDVIAEDEPSGYNLLYWEPHGPSPSFIYAWSHLQKYYPDVRTIPVKNHRVEVIVDLRDVRSEPSTADSTGAQFTSGTVNICWKRTKNARAAD